MKNIKLILSAVLLGFVFSSCSLKEESYTKISVENYMTDASQADAVLNGIYKELCNSSIYGLNLSMIFELPTDELKVNGNSLVGARQQASNAYLASDSYVQGTWGALYEGIYRANHFMETLAKKMPDYTETDKNLAAVQMGEAKCLRALFYFELVRRFGNIPLMTKTEQSSQHPSTFKQADPLDVYKLIEQDLTEAAEALPWASADKIRSGNEFRFSKGAALGLLTKVYATWAGYPLKDESKWEKAKDTAAKLVNSGMHSLLPDYEQLWKNSGAGTWDPKESLIEVSFYAIKATSGMNGYNGKWNGVGSTKDAIRSGYNLALTTFVPVFLEEWVTHEGDLRPDLVIADYKYGFGADGSKGQKISIATGTVDKVKVDVTFRMAADPTTYGWNVEWRRYYSQTIYPRKFDNEIYVPDSNLLVDYNLSNQNWYVLRYADVLLLYAEALNEYYKGPTADAYDCINKVRRRGYGLDIETSSVEADLPWGLSYEEFQAAVRKERSYELTCEGQRRMDLMRWGIYCETIQDTYDKLAGWHEIAPSFLPAIDYTIKGKTELMPIPQREIDLCGYKQNPNW